MATKSTKRGTVQSRQKWIDDFEETWMRREKSEPTNVIWRAAGSLYQEGMSPYEAWDTIRLRRLTKRDPARRPPGFHRNAPIMVWINPDKDRYTVAITGYNGWRIYQVTPSGSRHLQTLSAFSPPAEWGKRIALKNVNQRVSEFIKEERSSPDRWTSRW